MPRRYPQPFWRSGCNCWHVQIGKKQVRLDPDRDEAFRMYHAMMQQPGSAQATAIRPDPPVVEILDTFLDWAEKNSTPRTFEWRKDNLQTFADSIPRGLTVSQLKPFHVTKEMHAHPTWGPDTQGNFARCVQRAFRWAKQQGLIDANPIEHVEKPKAEQREAFLTQAECDALLASFPDQTFRGVLITVWECGCRPQELFRVEARHVDPAGKRWVFPTKEAKGKKKPRVVYLSDTAWEITARLMAVHPTGPLFRNAAGEPWDKETAGRRFARKRKQLGKRHSLYSLRHSFCRRMLLSGMDVLTVSILMGHTSPAMIMKHYQHLQKNPEFLRSVLNGAAKPANGG